MGYSDHDPAVRERRPWNAGHVVGQKRPLKPRDIWAIRFFLDEHRRLRDRALFDLAIDSKLRGCDLVRLKIGDIAAAGAIRNRATIIQKKTSKPVQFEITRDTRCTLETWLRHRGGSIDSFVFPSKSIISAISVRANMQGWSMNGWVQSASTSPTMAPTPCAGPRQP